MISQVGDIIIDRIEDLPFMDKYAGVVRIARYKDPTAEGTAKTKIFPVSCKITEEQCDDGRYMDLCPDSKKKSVLYLEDTSLRPTKKNGHIWEFTATYDLICWLNMPKLGFSDCSYSGIAIAGILKKIATRPFNSGIYQLVNIQFAGQKPKSINPFAKYTYDETITQFLLYPYDYFALMLQVDFRVDMRCINIQDLGPALNCVDK